MPDLTYLGDMHVTLNSSQQTEQIFRGKRVGFKQLRVLWVKFGFVTTRNLFLRDLNKLIIVRTSRRDLIVMNI